MWRKFRRVDDMTEVLILLVAFFLGPIDDLGDGFMLYTHTFSDKESCNQYIIENQDWLYIYLSDRWGTLPDIYESKLLCMTSDEIKKYVIPKSGREITI